MKYSQIVISITVILICISLVCGYTLVKSQNYREILFGKIIYVDPGHGGKDNGTSFNGVLEDEINLKISGFIIEHMF